MGKIFSVYCPESFLAVVAKFAFDIFNDNSGNSSSVIIIVPNQEDVKLLYGQLKLYFHATVLAQVKVMSLSDIDQDLLANEHSFVRIMTPIRKLLLLMEFIKLWNSENGDNYPLSLGYELSSLLNEMHVHCIPISNLECLFDYDLPAHCQKAARFLSELSKKWKEVLNKDEVLDILEHRSLYIGNLIKYLQDEVLNCTVIFAGMVFDNFFVNFIQELYKLPNSRIIFPYVDISIDEKDWQLLEECHYQYYVKSLLDILKVNRNDIVFLGEPNHSVFVSSVFNFNLFLEKYHQHEIQNYSDYSRVKLITCISDEEEAQVVSMLIKENVNNSPIVFTNNLLLTKRINSIVNAERLLDKPNVGYLILSFILHTLEVVMSKWNPIPLLSLLKHPFVTLGYVKEDYDALISSFELKVIRSYSGYDFFSMENNVKEKVPDLLPFWEKITSVILPLVKVKHDVISSIVKAHIVCIQNLLEGNLVIDSNGYSKIQEFFDDLQNSCNGIKVYGMDVYYEILTSVLYSSFSLENYKLSTVNLFKRGIVIFAGFNEINYGVNSCGTLLNRWIRTKLGLPSIQREKGYFAYLLHSFFYADKIYITQSLKSFGKINEESIWIRRLGILAKLYDIENLKCEIYSKISDRFSCDDTKSLAYLRPQPNPDINNRVIAFNVLSTTSLETLVKNPYVFYLSNILNILPCKSINEKFSMRDFGIVVHNVLHKYLLCNNNQHRYEDLVEIAASELLDKYKDFPQVETILWPKFQKIAEQFFEINLERAHYVDEIITERFFSWEINSNIEVISRCDRVECLKDGSVIIIDYKTGAIPSQSDINYGVALQMIIQALTVKQSLKKEISGLMYWKISSEDMRIVPIDNYTELIKKLEVALKQLILDYVEFMKPFTASCDMSKYADYDLITRVKEWGYFI
ncbi:PD-(D/E)XK nuclease superfamily protein [Ehrlichia chaffeensis str. Liberty]|uniref:PD-(D/E)XK nuclease family protein n=1 Tax=Ehrlichia chaffeensis TaxID=945 RepID=UPI000444B9E7|nr:PD-(D/E)XK nuclease family protein [Ehrlichia chaffeensis]AHX05401.1 PD-(D/E)XK nuclease superfamily protein [Ehrlichia chaffeensis str. Jax]AHX06388.1 PD-(D/E)XK nuclease superfamily protein [Ehrlichia chaffeensis str. Liberty]